MVFLVFVFLFNVVCVLAFFLFKGVFVCLLVGFDVRLVMFGGL